MKQFEIDYRVVLCLNPQWKLIAGSQFASDNDENRIIISFCSRQQYQKMFPMLLHLRIFLRRIACIWANVIVESVRLAARAVRGFDHQQSCADSYRPRPGAKR